MREELSSVRDVETIKREVSINVIRTAVSVGWKYGS